MGWSNVSKLFLWPPTSSISLDITSFHLLFVVINKNLGLE